MKDQHFTAEGSKYNAVYTNATPAIYDEWANDGYDNLISGSFPANSVVSTALISALKSAAHTHTHTHTHTHIYTYTLQ